MFTYLQAYIDRSVEVKFEDCDPFKAMCARKLAAQPCLMVVQITVDLRVYHQGAAVGQSEIFPQSRLRHRLPQRGCWIRFAGKITRSSRSQIRVQAKAFNHGIDLQNMAIGLANRVRLFVL